jgi:hypothetical protein
MLERWMQILAWWAEAAASSSDVPDEQFVVAEKATRWAGRIP